MRKLGTINGYVSSVAWLGNKSFTFDGTLKGLVLSATAIGAKSGDKLKANFGGISKSSARDYTIIAAPHDDRANGFWAESN